MSELKGNDNQKQKAFQPCTHVYFCNKSVSARNGCYRISSVWGWKVISHLVFISPKCNKSVSARNGCYRISSVWGWKVISHLVFISPKDTVRVVRGVINLYLPVMAVTEFQAFGVGR